MSINAVSQQSYSNLYLALGASFGSTLSGGGGNCNSASAGAAPSTPTSTPSSASTNVTGPTAMTTPSTTPANGASGGGLHVFFSAVLEAFARITGGDSTSSSSNPAATGATGATGANSSPPGSASGASNTAATGESSSDDAGNSNNLLLRAKEKIQFDLQVQDNGDVSLNVEVDAKVKTSGGSARDNAQSASDMMKALQDFTANLFSALQNMVSGLLSGNSATPASAAAAGSATPATGGTVTAPSTPSTPSAGAVSAQGAVASATAGTSAAAATTAPAAPTADLTGNASAPGTTNPNPTAAKIPSLYVSFEFKLRALIDDVTRADRNDPTLPKERHERVHHLREHFNKVANALPVSNANPSAASSTATPAAANAGNQSATAPSLIDFLNQLSSGSARAVTLAYSVRAGALLSVQA